MEAIHLRPGEIGRGSVHTDTGVIGVYASLKGITRVVLGDVVEAELSRGEVLLAALDGLKAYMEGLNPELNLALDIEPVSGFRVKVWNELKTISYGKTVSYGDLADRAGCRGGARAVGAALAANPCPILIPCHRVIRADGSLGGFSAGISWKEKLLRIEGAV